MQKDKIKKITIIILSFILMIGLCGCDSQVQTPNPELVLEYEHYDPSDFDSKLSELESLIETDNSEKLLALYDELYNELLYIKSLSCICQIEFDKDYTDEYYGQELDYIMDLDLEYDDKFKTIVHKIAISEDGQDLKEHIAYEGIFDGYYYYEEYSDEVMELLSKENDLSLQYQYIDKKDPSAKVRCANIFVELVSIRKQIAKAFGYDDYSKLCDEGYYERYFEAEELHSLYNAVKSLNTEKIYEMDGAMYEILPYYDVDGKEILKDTITILQGTSDLIDEALNYMVDNHLYYFDNGEYNSSVGYTLEFYNTQTPFIFNNIIGDFVDIFYQIHEFGHFTNYYYCKSLNPLFSDGNYDLAEIQSTGLELIKANDVSKVIKDYDNNLKYYDVISIIENSVIFGCLYDEWQREIYQSNKEMSIEEIDDLFLELCHEYGLDLDGINMSYRWIYNEHSFTSPLYYISYATSGFASLQLWLLAQEDEEKAIDIYEEIVQKDNTLNNYMDVMDEVGLVKFSNQEKTKEILNKVVDICYEGIFE